MTTYIDHARQHLAALLPGQDAALLDLYALLALTRGQDVTLEDVHDAWALWCSRSNPQHKSIVPFERLDPDVQALDQRYADAITAVARELEASNV